jgi:manganese/zinc/iron transport system ATP- binding protein
VSDRATAEARPLVVEGLSAGYSRDAAAIEACSFALEPRTVTAIIGPNGAGKSTLLKALLGRDATDGPSWTEGSAAFFGSDFAHARSRVAVVPQRSEVDWNFPATALDVALMGCLARLGLFRRISREARDTARAALEAVGLLEKSDSPIGALSGGQRQRVLLARALAQQADLLILDEPFANVDAASERGIADALRRHAARGGTVLAVLHDLHAVRRDCDRALLLDRRILAHGAAHEVLSSPRIAQAYGLGLALDPALDHGKARA